MNVKISKFLTCARVTQIKRKKYFLLPSFILGLGGMLPMMLVLAFIYTVCMNIKSLVLEKEMRLKEVLRAVGIQNWALWASRFTENIALLVVPCALISILVKVSGDPSAV